MYIYNTTKSKLNNDYYYNRNKVGGKFSCCYVCIYVELNVEKVDDAY